METIKLTATQKKILLDMNEGFELYNSPITIPSYKMYNGRLERKNIREKTINKLVDLKLIRPVNENMYLFKFYLEPKALKYLNGSFC